MNPINQLFEKKSANILSVYFTAGYPNLEDTLPVIQALVKNGVDMIEIGMPYSDPVADGPVIESSSARAIENGMTIKKLFDQLSELKQVKDVPLVLMGYLNPVMQFGFEQFCKQASDCGISGLIIPDLPLREFKNEFRHVTEKYGLHFIFLVTPETSEERIRMIDELSHGFIYAVSSSSVTGRDTDENRKEAYLQKLKAMNLKNPVVVGFGIKDKKTFQQACRYTNGAITGTAYVKIISAGGDFDKLTKDFVESFSD